MSDGGIRSTHSELADFRIVHPNDFSFLGGSESKAWDEVD